jgi:glycosyltransferase involved in cell wall biosynthesis
MTAPVPEKAPDALATIVVPARNEEAFIGPCLDSILAQDERDLDVIVVDGGSTDRTVQIVQRYMRRDPRVRLVHNPDAIVPTALNAALRSARGRWLVRVDAHATIPPGYVRRAVHLLETGRWGGVGGRKDGVGRTPAGRAIAEAMTSRFGVGNSTYHHGTSPRLVDHVPFGAYPTALARALGGWDERCEVNQDFEFDYRLTSQGYRILFDPTLVIQWHCRQSVSELFRQYRRYGRGKALVVRLHPRSMKPRHALPPALVALLGGAIVVGTRRPRWGAMAMMPYAAAVLAASVLGGRRLADWPARLRLPGAFLAMHVGWGLGFWEGAARHALEPGGPAPTAPEAAPGTSFPRPRPVPAASGRLA